MASIVCFGVSSIAANTGTTSQVCVYPDGYVAIADDLALLYVTQTGSNSAVTTPAGYTLIRRTERTTTHVDLLYRRKLGAGTGVPTVACAATSGLICNIIILRGVDTVTAMDVADVSNTGTSLSLHAGADVGVLVTQAAMVMTFASADHCSNPRGIHVYEDPYIVPFTALGTDLGVAAGATSQTVGRAVAFHHVPVPTETFWPRTH